MILNKLRSLNFSKNNLQFGIKIIIHEIHLTADAFQENHTKIFTNKDAMTQDSSTIGGGMLLKFEQAQNIKRETK